MALPVVIWAKGPHIFPVLWRIALSLLPEGSREVYFEAAAVIVTLILLRLYLEARAKGAPALLSKDC